MNFEKLKDKAKQLLAPFDDRYYQTLSEINWIEDNNGNSDWGDYCENCIDEAVKNVRKEYLLEQRKKPINKRDDEFLKFEKHKNYGGGYEDDDFNCCETCGKELNISILPNEQSIGYIIEDLKRGKIDDQIGYRAYNLLYNAWSENDERYKKETKLTIKLAKRVIKILNAVSVSS